MTDDVRIDQLAPHPQSVASPVDMLHTKFPVRDATLASDNTRSMDFYNTLPYTSNVLHYGADPHGILDSTAAIQAAINNTGYHGICFLPHGQYNITQIQLEQGVSLVGSGIGNLGTKLVQVDGVNDHAIVAKQYLVNNHYIHWTQVRDFSLVKVGHDQVYNDTSGDGIYIDNNCGEGTKFQNLLIENFWGHGLHIRGAITCWMQDLHLFGNGQGYANGAGTSGFGLYLDHAGGNSFTGHYVLGISGDNNGPALIGAWEANVWISGVKSERNAQQHHAVQLYGSVDGNWAHISNVTHTGSSTPYQVGQSSVVHIVDKGAGYHVMLDGIGLHSGAVEPDFLIKDDLLVKTIPWDGRQNNTYWSSLAGGQLASWHATNGVWNKTHSDPPLDTGSMTTFAMGHTNGVGTSATGNLQGKSGGGTGPTSLTQAKWVRAQLDGVYGWVPFFT